VLLTGPVPIRSAALVTQRRYAEITVPATGFADRRDAWRAAFSWLPSSTADDLAARFRLPPGDVAAVAAMDRAARAWAAPDQRLSLEALAGLVSRQRSPRLATVRAGERDAAQLVLPPAELAQVMEVAEAARAWPRVADAWRLDRFGNPGVTALFAGDPGTGKTLAAEVIATEVGVDLMMVDASRLVSKWIGETEKHLDTVFTEAEATSCVLFFDEADSLFGQRGEVSRAADRYANLEVGYLLQRLERYQGLVILASNLRDNLDPAFTRRFHHIVHFPRPEPEQRRRLWQIALAPPVRTTEPIDLDLLAALDLTGAGIAAVVRGAALIAHAAGRDAVGPDDLVVAAGRQFRREARLLPRELLDVAGTPP
jgi:ATP-dependent Clp protease ATP-binding subunit ClpA